MSTRSVTVIKTTLGAIALYRHWDGYPAEAGAGAVAVKAIAGVFPAYERVVHRAGPGAFSVPSAALQAAVKRVCLLASLNIRDSHGGDTAEWPEDLRVREFPR